jgi:hypothetical protein
MDVGFLIILMNIGSIGAMQKLPLAYTILRRKSGGIVRYKGALKPFFMKSTPIEQLFTPAVQPDYCDR